jgi:hypothetical protein
MIQFKVGFSPFVHNYNFNRSCRKLDLFKTSYYSRSTVCPLPNNSGNLRNVSVVLEITENK